MQAKSKDEEGNANVLEQESQCRRSCTIIGNTFVKDENLSANLL